MQTSKHKLAQRLFFVISPLLFVVGCASPSNLPTDEALVEQLTREQSAWLSLIEACSSDSNAYNLAERYLATDPLIPTTTVEKFTGCEMASTASESGINLKYLAKLPEGEAYLLVTDQYRKGTGWIEDSVSKWTGGWISWKTAIWEEKGFVYVAQEGLDVSKVPLQRMSISGESLDQFSGEYRVTSQISGNGCEIWRLRPTDPGWYLFYHQARECAD